jgi:hypothetical protein
MKKYYIQINALLYFLIPIICISCTSNQKIRAKEYNCYDGKSGKILPLIDCYQLGVAYLVSKKWNFHPENKCDQNDITSIVISIMPDGKIKTINYVHRSKCEGLDESAYLAVMSATPFKPFPNEIKDDLVELGLRFSPEGVK